MALRRRIGLFERVVGPLQPILDRMPALIAGNVISGQPSDAAEAFERAVDTAAGGFELEAALETALAEAERPSAPIVSDDLERVTARPGLLRAGSRAEALTPGEYACRETWFGGG